MPYIYLITNDINNHQYIGKTEYSDIQKRFKEHYKESKKSRTEQRPLYRAIRKYGIELIAIYSSVQEAEQAVPTGRHIGQVCTGKRKTAGGYIWRYVEE